MSENEDINFDEQLQLWVDIAGQKLQKALKRYKIGVTGNLAKSIATELIKNGGNAEKAIFKFAAYGRFVDMGTGREFARGARGSAAFAKYRNENGSLKNKSRREPKPWYSKTMFREIKILSEKLLADMSEQALSTMAARMRRINTHSNKA